MGLQICNNGKLYFNFLGFCQVSALPNNYQATIAPFVADVDTTPFSSGIVYYELSTTPSLLNQAKNQILQAYRDDYFNPTLLVIATYDHVGYYQLRTDKVYVPYKCAAYYFSLIPNSSTRFKL